LAHAETVKQQGGIEKLLASIRDIDKLRANNLAMYQEAVELLQIEAAEDDKSRTRHGTDRWNREPSTVAAGKIAEQVAEYKNYLEAAETTDKRVRGMLAESESMLRLLGGPPHQLEEFVPNSSRATLTPKMDREVGKLRQCMNEVSRLESRRRRKIEALRQKAKADDISKPPAIVLEPI
jgi:programmed cell death 6-interacting protein